MDGLERGPPYYPESSGWVPGLRSRFEGGGWGWEGAGGLPVWVPGCRSRG